METQIPKKKYKGNHNDVKWINASVRNCISKKNTLFKKYLISRAEYDFQKYKKSRNACNQVIIKAKRDYERNIAKNSKDNPKLFWKFVQSKTKSTSGVSLLVNEEGRTVVNDTDKANTLNSFFSSVFTKENLDNVPSENESSKAKDQTLTDIQITAKKVAKKLKGINANGL